MSTRETPKRIPQRSLVTLLANLHIYLDPQPAKLSPKAPNSVLFYIRQIWIANGEKIRTGLTCEVLHASENHGGGCETDAEAEQGRVKVLEFLDAVLQERLIRFGLAARLKWGTEGDGDNA